MATDYREKQKKTIAISALAINKLRVLHPGRIGIWSVGLCGGRKTRERKLPEQVENQRQTQPIYDTGPELNSGPINGRALTKVPSLLPRDMM